MTGVAGIESSMVARGMRPHGATMWSALVTAPHESHVRLTVGGIPEPSVTATREMITRSAGVANFCRMGQEQITVYGRGVNAWHPETVLELCSAYGASLWNHGLTDGESRIDIFAGNYSATPGGIHREPCRNRHLIVDGVKCFYFWDQTEIEADGAYETVSTYPTERGDEQYLSTSLREIESSALQIRASSGCCLAWPDWQWHVASTLEPCLSINIASYGSSESGAIRTLAIQREADGELPREWVQNYCEFNRDLRSTHLIDVIAAVSAAGVWTPRRKGRAPSRPSRAYGSVRRITYAPAIWVRDGDRTIVGLGGQGVAIPADGEAGVAWLGSGTHEEFSPATDGDVVLAEWLCSIGAVALGP